MDLLEKKLEVLRELRDWCEQGSLAGVMVKLLEHDYAVRKLKKLYRELEREYSEKEKEPAYD